METSVIDEMKKEYEKGGDFAEYINRCMNTYKTDLMVELNKAITREVYLWMLDSRKGKIDETSKTNMVSGCGGTYG